MSASSVAPGATLRSRRPAGSVWTEAIGRVVGPSGSSRLQILAFALKSQ